MKLKTSYTCSAWLMRMSKLSRFVYIMSCDTRCEIQRRKFELCIECVQCNVHGIECCSGSLGVSQILSLFPRSTIEFLWLISLVALSSSDFMSLFSTSNTFGDRTYPFFCISRSLISPEDIVLVILDVVKPKCSRGSWAAYWITEDLPVIIDKNKIIKKLLLLESCSYRML